MLFKIYQLGENSIEGLDEAVKMLNSIQTVWKIQYSSKTPKPPSFEIDDNLLAIQASESSSEFSIGVTSGRVDIKNELYIIDPEKRRCIITEYEWKTLRRYEPSKLFWAFALVQVCFHVTSKSECQNPDCIGFKKKTIDTFLLKVLQMEICPTCDKSLSERFKYHESEIRNLLYWIKRPSLYNSPQDFKKSELPILERQIRRHSTIGKVFEQYGIIIVMHFLHDLVPFVEGLLELGAQERSMDLLIKPYPYGQKSAVHWYFQNKHPDIRLDYLENLPPPESLLKEIVDYCHSRSSAEKFLVIEDGGYLVPFLHEKYPESAKYCIGAVEQTTKGLKKDRKIKEFLFPILNVAKSNFKDEYEAPLVGHAIVANIIRLLSQKTFFGAKVLVVGFGAIGRTAAEALTKSVGAIVRVYDSRPERVIAAKVRGYEASTSPSEFAKDARMIIGTTGETSIDNKILEEMTNGTILVSASSDQVEIDIPHLRIIAGSGTYEEGLGTYYDRKIGGGNDRYLLLGDGFPINFFSGYGIPDEAIDPILSQLFLGGVHLATNYLSLGVGIKDVMDDLIEKNGLLVDFIAEHNRR